MISDYKHIAQLVQSLHEGTITDLQKIELRQWVDQDKNRLALLENTKEWDFLKKELTFFHLAKERSSKDRRINIQNSVLNRIETRHGKLSRKNIYVLLTVALAACFLLFMWFNQPKDKTELIPQAIGLNDPLLNMRNKGNNATLTLPNGEQISLTASNHSIVIGKTINYTDGKIPEDLDHTSLPNNSILTLSTPARNYYHIELSDGSEVWLNANSSLRYPKQFDHNARVVELVGEGYFSVKKSKYKTPFLVKTKGQTLRVLGTQFNISSNLESNITKTTLVEGKIELQSTDNDHRLILAPNQQAQFDGTAFKRENIDIEPIIAWKNGNFYFDGESPEQALQDISQWYNIAIKYDKIPKLPFFGYIEKSNDLATVLKIFKDSGLHFTIKKQGEKIELQITNE